MSKAITRIQAFRAHPSVIQGMDAARMRAMDAGIRHGSLTRVGEGEKEERRSGASSSYSPRALGAALCTHVHTCVAGKWRKSARGKIGRKL